MTKSAQLADSVKIPVNYSLGTRKLILCYIKSNNIHNSKGRYLQTVRGQCRYLLITTGLLPESG